MDQWVRRAAAFAGCMLAAALIALPIVLERAVESVRFDDHLGTFPVEVRLCHNGHSTLDTGILGEVFWEQTGAYGFGACARATGPPEAGGSLASYVDDQFVRANVALINDPATVVEVYAAQFETELRKAVGRGLLVAMVLGGALIYAVLPWARMRLAPAGREVAVGVILVVAAAGVSTATSLRLFDGWEGNGEPARSFPMPGIERLSFGSPEMLEVARQVRPFVDKNLERLKEDGRIYEARADASFATALADQIGEVTPRPGEVVVLAEADPQGSLVGVRVRTAMYERLIAALGEDVVALRTISGDVTSNGTVAETSYVGAEVRVAEGVPVAAVGGDHDSEETWRQLTDNDVTVPDLETVDAGGLRVAGANDREHKTLFGGLVTNEEGISETDLGARLREAVDDEAQIVLLHQPEAAAGYLGIDHLDRLALLEDSPRAPYEDGIPDLPAGIVNVGHLHETDGPWVVWNTDSDEVTWTLVDQLGTAGGVQNRPTFNEFSTPTSAPLKPLSVRLQYVDEETGLARGYVTISCSLAGACSVSERTDVGL